MPDQSSRAAGIVSAASLAPDVGAFVAVVGPSGAGKDTLISAAARTLQGEDGFFFPRRIVTRAALLEAEDHHSMAPAEFARADAAGFFCLTWNAHGLSYGLPACILEMLREKQTVVANISRQILRDAAERFPRLHVIEVTAPHEILVQRIAARGRETPAEIDLRLRRRVGLEVPPEAEGSHRVENAGAIETAVETFVTTLLSIRRGGSASIPEVSGSRSRTVI